METTAIRYRRQRGEASAIYSVPFMRKRNGRYVTTRRRVALDGFDVFENGLIVLNVIKVRRSRGGWVFGANGYHTTEAWELKDVRFVEAV